MKKVLYIPSLAALDYILCTHARSSFRNLWYSNFDLKVKGRKASKQTNGQLPPTQRPSSGQGYRLYNFHFRVTNLSNPLERFVSEKKVLYIRALFMFWLWFRTSLMCHQPMTLRRLKKMIFSKSCPEKAPKPCFTCQNAPVLCSHIF